MDEPLHTVADGARFSRSHGSDMVREEREKEEREKREKEKTRRRERRGRETRESKRERRGRMREKREYEYPVLFTVWSIVGRAHCTVCV